MRGVFSVRGAEMVKLCPNLEGLDSSGLDGTSDQNVTRQRQRKSQGKC